MKKTIWTNSNNKEFQIKSVSPFLEDEIRASIEWPIAPQYKVTQESPDGEFHQYYSHSIDTMTEPSQDPKNDPNLITNLPSPDGQIRRWIADSTPQERRIWTAYQLGLATKEQEFATTFMKLVVIEGVADEPSKEWCVNYAKRMRIGKNLTQDEAKYAFVLREVCASEKDLQSLFIAIQRLRQINADRVTAFESSFRSQPQRNAT